MQPQKGLSHFCLFNPADKLSPALLIVEAFKKRRPSQTEINNPWRDAVLAQLAGQHDILHRWPAGRGQDPRGSGGVVRAEWSSEQATTREGSSCSEEFVLPWR